MTDAFRAYNVFVDACNGEWLGARWEGHVCHVGTYAAGTGTVRRISLDAGSLDRMSKYDLDLLVEEVESAVVRRNAAGCTTQEEGRLPPVADDGPRDPYEGWGEPMQAALPHGRPFVTISSEGRVTFSPDVTIDLDGLTVGWLRMVRALADEAIRRKLKGEI